METDPKENNHKVHPAVIAVIIAAAAAVAAAALIIGIRMKKKGS